VGAEPHSRYGGRIPRAGNPSIGGADVGAPVFGGDDVKTAQRAGDVAWSAAEIVGGVLLRAAAANGAATGVAVIGGVAISSPVVISAIGVVGAVVIYKGIVSFGFNAAAFGAGLSGSSRTASDLDRVEDYVSLTGLATTALYGSATALYGSRLPFSLDDAVGFFETADQGVWGQIKFHMQIPVAAAPTRPAGGEPRNGGKLEQDGPRDRPRPNAEGRPRPEVHTGRERPNIERPTLPDRPTQRPQQERPWRDPHPHPPLNIESFWRKP
jgi:hypothetical protein